MWQLNEAWTNSEWQANESILNQPSLVSWTQEMEHCQPPMSYIHTDLSWSLSTAQWLSLFSFLPPWNGLAYCWNLPEWKHTIATDTVSGLVSFTGCLCHLLHRFVAVNIYHYIVPIGVDATAQFSLLLQIFMLAPTDSSVLNDFEHDFINM